MAETTYTQIIDGLPLADVVQDTANGGLSNDHPIHDAHTELCPGVIEKTRGLRANFEPSILALDAAVCDRNEAWVHADDAVVLTLAVSWSLTLEQYLLDQERSRRA